MPRLGTWVTICRKENCSQPSHGCGAAWNVVCGMEREAFCKTRKDKQSGASSTVALSASDTPLILLVKGMDDHAVELDLLPASNWIHCRCASTLLCPINQVVAAKPKQLDSWFWYQSGCNSSSCQCQGPHDCEEESSLTQHTQQ